MTGLLLGLGACASGSAEKPPETRTSASKPPPRRSRLPGPGQRNAAPGQAELEAAMAAARAGDLDEARAESEAAIAANPRIEQAYLLLGSACALQGNDACEAAAYERGMEALPRSVPLQREQGFLLLRQGRVAEGVQQLEAARAASPSVRPELLADLAVAYKMAGDLERASATAVEAIEADPACVPCHMAAGEVSLAKKRFGEAKQAFGQAVQKDPENVEARRSQAKAAFLAGEMDEAVELYIDLARRAPDDLRVRVQTAQVLMRAERPEDAVPHLEAAVSLLPQEPKLLELLAEAQAEAGMVKEAEATRTRASALRSP